MAKIDEYLEEILKRDGSDLHFMAGDPPRIRQYGKLSSLRAERLGADFVREALYEIMPRKALERFETRDGTDFAYTLGTIARFRVNVLRQLNGLGGVFRAIPSKAQTLEQLKMPEAVRNLCKASNGLILVTGKTGSGKSTTLAAMIDDLNLRLKGHILTIEDPIEFVHPRKNCLISQREVGVHAESFASALLSALREDPDVILVGELRDLETISTAITAAEMGILVMATLHTNGSAATVDRIVNAFPADKQNHVRTMLSTSLRGVVSQQLISRKGVARPRRGARGPDQYARGCQPDPPGQDRPARVHHAVGLSGRHAHHGFRDRAAAGPGADQRPFRLTKSPSTSPSSSRCANRTDAGCSAASSSPAPCPTRTGPRISAE